MTPQSRSIPHAIKRELSERVQGLLMTLSPADPLWFEVKKVEVLKVSETETTIRVTPKTGSVLCYSVKLTELLY
jgi:hypothetical protein